MRAKKALRPRSKKQREGSLQDAIEELLTLKYKLRWKENKVHGPAKALHGSSFINGCGTTGEADLTVYVPHPCGADAFLIVHLEVKNAGKYQRPEQKTWQKLVEGNGEKYRVIRSQEDVDNYFKEMGWSK